jgi:hypothetical protein
MSDTNEKPADDIEGQFRVSDGVPDKPLSELRREAAPENIVIVERVVEKPVERIVYRERPTVEHRRYGYDDGGPSPYSLMSRGQKVAAWLVVALVLLLLWGFIYISTSPPVR